MRKFFNKKILKLNFSHELFQLTLLYVTNFTDLFHLCHNNKKRAWKRDLSSLLVKASNLLLIITIIIIIMPQCTLQYLLSC